MLSRRRFASTLLLFALVVTWNLVPTSRPVKAQGAEMTLQELTRTSSAVIVGTATTKRSYWNESRSKIYTAITISVDEHVTGEAQDETIVTVPGGRVGNTLYDVSDMPVFVEGEEVLLFLWRHPSGSNLVTGGAHGKLEVVRDIRTGRKMLRGAGHLADQPLSKSGIPPEIGPNLEARNLDVPLEDFMAQIKASARQ